MYLKKGLKISITCLIVSMFIIDLSLPFLVSIHPSLAKPDYTYYGVVPSKIYRYILNDMNNRNSGWRLDNGTIVTASPLLNGMTVATKALLAIATAVDNTHVKVYDLGSPNNPVDEFDINNMGKHYVLLDNGTRFKVVSNYQVSVLLLNYQASPSASTTEGPMFHTFYTDINGLYVGKEFVFMASSFSYFSVNQNGFYTILAIEKSTVTVTKDDGTENTYTINANSYQNILLNSFRVYKFESTGNIMIQTATVPSIANSGEGMGDVSCFPVPSVQGGFVGTFFLTKSVKGWDSNRDYGYRIEALENAQVKVFDLETKQLLTQLSVAGGSGVAFKPSANAIAVQSDKPITLSLTHNGSIEQSRPLAGNKGGEYSGFGHGVMFMGIQPNQNTMIFLPTEAYVEAYFFASDDTQLTIDGEAQTLHANTPLLYTVIGTHTVRSDKNVVLQINFWPLEPEYQGLWFTGTAIPSIETVGNNPTVTITSFEEGFPMMYIIIGGAAAAVVVIVAVLLMMRKRGSKPS